MSSALIATEHIQIELTLEITWAPPSSLLCQFNVFQRQPAFQSLCVFTGCQLAATYLFFFSDSTTSMPKSYFLSLSLSLECLLKLCSLPLIPISRLFLSQHLTLLLSHRPLRGRECTFISSNYPSSQHAAGSQQLLVEHGVYASYS